MVEDIGLNFLVFFPYLVCDEEIDFYRQSELAWLPLRYYHIEIPGHFVMTPEILFYIDPVEL